MFPQRLVVPDSLAIRPGRVAFSARIPWYRALPFSCLDFAVTIDGKPVNQSEITAQVDGRPVPVDELADLSETYWFTTDALALECKTDVTGPTVAVGLTIGMRVPYIIAGDSAVRIEEHLTTELTGAEIDA